MFPSEFTSQVRSGYAAAIICTSFKILFIFTVTLPTSLRLGPTLLAVLGSVEWLPPGTIRKNERHDGSDPGPGLGCCTIGNHGYMLLCCFIGRL